MNYILGLLFFIIIFRLVFSMFTQYLVRKARKSAHAEDFNAGNTTHTPSKKKRISKDKGDYVDFEEID